MEVLPTVAFRSGKGSIGTSPSMVFLCRETGPDGRFFADAPGISVNEKDSGVGAAFCDAFVAELLCCFAGSAAGGVSSSSAFALIVSCSPSSFTSSSLKGNESSLSSRSRGLGG